NEARGTAADQLTGRLSPEERASFEALVPALERATSTEVLLSGPFETGVTMTWPNGKIASYRHRAGEKTGVLGQLGSDVESAAGLGDSIDPKTSLPESVAKLRALADRVSARLEARIAPPGKFDSLTVVTTPDGFGYTATVRLGSDGTTAVDSATSPASLGTEQVARFQALFASAGFARVPVLPESLGKTPDSKTGPAIRVTASWDLGEGVTASRSVFMPTVRQGDGLAPRVDEANASAAPLFDSLQALASYATTAKVGAATAKEARLRIANDGEVPGLDYADAPLFPHAGDREREIQRLTDLAKSADESTAAAREGFIHRLGKGP
ncbi:MAG TPA: hypothetical protein VFF73_06730, partial [Planctomycetota bacterium]|nr:hypothetical protein [Planctomycetota bacterium]